MRNGYAPVASHLQAPRNPVPSLTAAWRPHPEHQTRWATRCSQCVAWAPSSALAGAGAVVATGCPDASPSAGPGPSSKQLVVAERVILAVVVHCFRRARVGGQGLTRTSLRPRVATNSVTADAVAYGGLVRHFTVYPMGAFAAQEGHGEEAVVESGN